MLPRTIKISKNVMVHTVLQGYVLTVPGRFERGLLL